jgi:alpha-beta hydrolase superfamily lysophospholipase
MADPRAFHGWYGEPAAWVAVQLPGGPASTLGVVLCTPLGQDGVVAYRGLRLLADELGRRGIATVRYDPPGRGDAAPSDDPDAVFEGARSAAAILREAGCSRIGFVGLSSAALIASVAAGQGDVVVLWSPPSSGRQWLRRARSLATIMLGPDRVDDGVESLIGLELTEPQAAALAGVSLVAPDGSPALVVSRPNEPVPAGFAGATTVEVDDVAPFLDVSSASSVLPVASIGLIADWLGTQAGDATTELRAPQLQAELELCPAVERIRWLGPNRLFAIETRPRPDRPDAPVLLLNSGAAEHRVGPGDFQVELARRLAADGVATVRLDRRGTGETGTVAPDAPDLIYAAEWIEDQENAIDALAVPSDRLAVGGLCSGAWVAAQPASRSRRLYLAIHPARYDLAPMAPGAFVDEVAPTVVTGGFRLWLQNRYRRWAPTWVRRLRARRLGGTDASAFLRVVASHSGRAVLVFSEVDHEIFQRVGGEELIAGMPNVETVELPTIDHPLFARRTRQAMLAEVRGCVLETFTA